VLDDQLLKTAINKLNSSDMKDSIYPCIWFDKQAKEAAEFYCSAFPESEVKCVTPLVTTFAIRGKLFMGLDGGPQHQPNPSVSFFQVFKSDEELSKAWNMLSEGGKVMMPLDTYPWSSKYGWLEDKFGVSWQLSLAMSADEGPDVFPSLMFTGQQNGKAQQAIDFYTSLFPDSKVSLISKYEAGEHDREGNIKHAQIYLNGYRIALMESSMDHKFDFNWGVSLVVNCDTQEEIDYYWNTIAERGKPSMCGWTQDEFGLWWQIVPASLGTYMTDPAKAPKVMEAFMKMSKFNIAELEQAAS
jgi:predicted 3-demethylubiquinone-9 3-methyltransferase (glyoxalase superfamily)